MRTNNMASIRGMSADNFGLAWLAKPKAIAVIPKCQIIYGKKRVQVLSTNCHYARPVRITIYLGSGIIKFTTNFDSCAI